MLKDDSYCFPAINEQCLLGQGGKVCRKEMQTLGCYLELKLIPN